MKRTTWVAALAISSAAVTAAPAQAITLNDGTPKCVSCANGTFRDMEIGDRYVVSEASFVDAGDQRFDILVEVLGAGAAPDPQNPSVALPDGRIRPFDLQGLNRYVHLKIKTIAHATGPMADRSFDAIVVEGLDTVEIQDVDSNAGQDFTDVAGVNLQVASYGDALEAGGFDFVGPPLEGFNYARAAQPDGQGWRNVGNTRNGAAYTVSYLADGGISEFEFVWGSNGPKRSDGAVRGWDIAFSASSAVVPLPAGVLLALSGFGALGVLQAWKRRRSA